MTAKEIKQKPINIGAWEQFKKNYMSKKNPKDENKKTTTMYLSSCKKDSFLYAIYGAFTFKDTPEGFNFWDTIAKS